ncbi:MAG: undecaprenyl-phosphate galactose phosphotransferase WbaP [Deltaproteobacteria bacterium]|nr:undecaprenyl-phosphate galactose phosphotransferase WbaP [Deltaproteobacteria bacterium]
MTLARKARGVGAAIGLVSVDLAACFVSALVAFGLTLGVNRLWPALAPLGLSLRGLLHLWWIRAAPLAFIGYGGLYRTRLPFWDEARVLLRSISAGMVLAFAIVALGKLSGSVSRLSLLLLWLCSLFVFPSFRALGKRLLYRVGLWRENVLVLGAGPAGAEMARVMGADSYMGYHVAGFLGDDPEKVGQEMETGQGRRRVLDQTSRFRQYLDPLDVSTVVIALPAQDAARVGQLAQEVQTSTRTVLLVPDLKCTASLNAGLHPLFMEELYLIQIRNNLESGINRASKAAFDLIVSLLALPVLLTAIGVISVLIKLDSPGPVFYVHPRVGHRRRIIPVLKFRTMFEDAADRLLRLLQTDGEARLEWETGFKLRNDPRTTRIGKFLRTTSLDELPQILNVLRGEMSLVGPRPVLQEELDKYYGERVQYYEMVRPGITGLWQVSGRSETGYETRVWLDTWYVSNWCVWFDLVIFFKTVRALFGREGAY